MDILALEIDFLLRHTSHVDHFQGIATRPFGCCHSSLHRVLGRHYLRDAIGQQGQVLQRPDYYRRRLFGQHKMDILALELDF